MKIIGVVGAAVAVIGASVATMLKIGPNWRIAWPVAMRNFIAARYGISLHYSAASDVLNVQFEDKITSATRHCASDPMVILSFDQGRNVVGLRVIGITHVNPMEWASLEDEIGSDPLFRCVLQHVLLIQRGDSNG